MSVPGLEPGARMPPPETVTAPAMLPEPASVAPEATATASAPIPDPTQVSNTLALGQLLYTRYVYFFQVAGLVLLVAMIGAITLTLRHRASVRRQNISVQVARTRATAIEVKHVEPGRGL